MLTKVLSSATTGIEATLVEVESNLDSGLPAFSVVGLPDVAVKESRERVTTAIKNMGYSIPPRRITVNLAPADIRKEGTSYDLPIAIGLLGCIQEVSDSLLSTSLIVGELALDGSLRRVSGILPTAMMAKKRGFKKLIVPQSNAKEAAIAFASERERTLVYGVSSLLEAVSILNGKENIEPTVVNTDDIFKHTETYGVNFSDIKGQEDAKKAIEIAAAGGHNVIMVGPPGSGKTMLAKALPSILPPLSFEESLETTKIYSVSGLLSPNQAIISERVFRSPHHTASNVALIGGGSNAHPGEVSLSHNGVLFLDELPEFSRQTLEALRQPLEDRTVFISRASLSVSYPSSFMLVAAMNPSPAGKLKDEHGNLTASPQQIGRYLSKISGPLLDRIDIHIDVPKVSEEDLITKKTLSESSEAVRNRVVKTRLIQQKRFSRHTSQKNPVHCNAQMSTKLIRTYCSIDKKSEETLLKSMKKLNLSARAHNRILKVSRTIADLNDSDSIQVEHIIQAISYRSLDREYWNY